MAFSSQFVIRVDLYGQFVLCIDVFDQQRKFEAEFLIHPITDQFAHVDFDQLFQIVAGQQAVADDRDVSVDTRNFPTLADNGIFGNPFPQSFAQ